METGDNYLSDFEEPSREAVVATKGRSAMGSDIVDNLRVNKQQTSPARAPSNASFDSRQSSAALAAHGVRPPSSVGRAVDEFAQHTG